MNDYRIGTSVHLSKMCGSCDMRKERRVACSSPLRALAWQRSSVVPALEANVRLMAFRQHMPKSEHASMVFIEATKEQIMTGIECTYKVAADTLLDLGRAI